jgi:putative acetyltransferase
VAREVLVVTASTPAEVDAVRTLMRAFLAWHRDRHEADRQLVERYFADGAVEDELAGLPGEYGPPSGALLLATVDGEPAGCVALRPLDAGDGERDCEMKRMFVPDPFRGLGVGRALAETVVERARDLGYRQMWLDTSVRQVEALGLYASLGFEEVAPYHDLPTEMVGWLVFRRLRL